MLLKAKGRSQSPRNVVCCLTRQVFAGASNTGEQSANWYEFIMPASVTHASRSTDALPVCLWQENPYRLVSLYDVLEFYAHVYCDICDLFGSAGISLFETLTPGFGPILPEFMEHIDDRLRELRAECKKINLLVTIDQIDTILERRRQGAQPAVIGQMLGELAKRVVAELKLQVFLWIPGSKKELYSAPLAEWNPVTDRFKQVSDDAFEAGRCLALERYTASVFHSMRVIEVGVLELEQFLDKHDVKAHIGSVIDKLERLMQRTKFDELAEHVQAHRESLKQVLPILHAIKDAWRDKVSHVGGRIIPTDGYSPEMALLIYGRTLELMKQLAKWLPNRHTTVEAC